MFLPEVFFQKIYSNCFFVTFGEDATAVSLDEAGLSHGSVSHNDNLK
jgi:hypothetical protein